MCCRQPDVLLCLILWHLKRFRLLCLLNQCGYCLLVINASLLIFIHYVSDIPTIRFCNFAIRKDHFDFQGIRENFPGQRLSTLNACFVRVTDHNTSEDINRTFLSCFCAMRVCYDCKALRKKWIDRCPVRFAFTLNDGVSRLNSIPSTKIHPVRNRTPHKMRFSLPWSVLHSWEVLTINSIKVQA